MVKKYAFKYGKALRYEYNNTVANTAITDF